MSIEIRKTIDGHNLECDWGTITSCRYPAQGEINVGPFILWRAEDVHFTIANGPQHHRGTESDIYLRPVCDGPDDLNENTDVRIFGTIKAENGSWTWELFPAHWWDSAENNIGDIYVGRWPD